MRMHDHAKEQVRMSGKDPGQELVNHAHAIQNRLWMP